MVKLGSHCDSSSLNTLECLWYSVGTPSVVGFGGLIITCPIKYHSVGVGCAFLYFPTILAKTKWAFFALGAWNMMGSWVMSIHPLAQSIFGCVAANHG
jgi:hypothetical protein